MHHEVDLVKGRFVSGITFLLIDLGPDLLDLLLKDETRIESKFRKESTPEVACPVQDVEDIGPEMF